MTIAAITIEIIGSVHMATNLFDFLIFTSMEKFVRSMERLTKFIQTYLTFFLWHSLVIMFPTGEN